CATRSLWDGFDYW
nr:immunoglobulin heavy chain junction region [Mus musculus]